jgi:hypothetical protein
MPRARQPAPPKSPSRLPPHASWRSDAYAEFLTDWETFTIKTVGRVLPINVITRGSSGYQSRAPLTTRDGSAVFRLWLRHDRFGELA